MRSPEQWQAAWQGVVLRVARELATLPRTERLWIDDALAAVGRLQAALHAEFLAVDGAAVCAACPACCCDRGRYHVTLVNLLAYLARGEVPPDADFAVTCPWLAVDGCRFEPGRRPFNCVTFICGAVEERMTDGGRARFYAAERELRHIYLDFDRRYAGSSLRGLLLRAERLGAAPFLAPLDPAGNG